MPIDNSIKTRFGVVFNETFCWGGKGRAGYYYRLAAEEATVTMEEVSV